ncbi:hypothetical protein TIFTF001_035968 [Ficus carica]|uniref:Uncharacterized protein n=1 Tax=Ficus carica TaxID=3494 RepID=A0AA88JCA6_FICCA|nr:hypothetical protein TIFTF001_035968 [Ficus carica]
MRSDSNGSLRSTFLWFIGPRDGGEGHMVKTLTKASPREEDWRCEKEQGVDKTLVRVCYLYSTRSSERSYEVGGSGCPQGFFPSDVASRLARCAIVGNAVVTCGGGPTVAYPL